jgi:hypothetical protein
MAQWPPTPHDRPSARQGPDQGPDRTKRFLTRVDVHLPSLADSAARRAFLDRQIDGWEHRYARFIATDGASEPVADPLDPPQAADFLLTIMGLATRRDALRNHQGKEQMPDRTETKPLGSAILSLLVAADQRCPAIIGQAHVLYHARFASGPNAPTQAFAQLKRDAADLFQAIAAVETALQDATLDVEDAPRLAPALPGTDG